LIKAAGGIHGVHPVFSSPEPDDRRGVLLSAPGTWPCRTTAAADMSAMSGAATLFDGQPPRRSAAAVA
jgi:hypothetical protein